ncbi:MAG: asparagine synthase-related protein [Elusimicrobiales bacterium]
MILIGSLDKKIPFKDKLKKIENNFNLRFEKISSVKDLYLYKEADEVFYFDKKDNVSVIFKGDILIEKNKDSAEYIYGIYKKYGDDFENYLDGWWSLIIIDELKNKITLSADIMGFGKMFYKLDGDFLWITNSLRYLYLFPHYNFLTSDLNKNFILDYLVYGVDPSRIYGSKILSDSRSILPFHKLIIYKNKSKNIKYFNLEINDQIGTFKEKEFLKRKLEFKELIKKSINKRIPQDNARYGMELSGGIDSNSILFNILNLLKKKKNKSRNIKIVHVVLEEEKKYFRLTENVLKKHKICLKKLSYKEPDFNHVLGLLFLYDNLLTSFNFISSNLMFSYFKSNDIDIVFDGDGPDEMLGGYDYKYIPLYLLNYLSEFDKVKFLKELDYYKDYLISFKKNFDFSSFKNIKSNLLSMNRYGRKNDSINKILSRKYKGYENNLFIKTNLADNLLFDFNNISTTSGTFLNYRRPYLDKEIVRFLFSLPICYKIYKGETKYILKKSMEETVPYEIIKRKKFGGIMSHNFKTDFVLKNKSNFLKFIEEDGYVMEFLDYSFLKSNFDNIAYSDPNILLRMLCAQAHYKAVSKISFYKTFL